MSTIQFRWYGRRGLCAAVLLLAGLAVMAGLLLVVPAGAAGDPATLTIVKETDPDGGMGFPFTLASDGAALMWGGAGDGAGQFLKPRGVAVDASGNLYVVEAQNNRVQKFTEDGSFVLAWGWDVISGNTATGFEVCMPTDTCKAGAGGSGNGQFSMPSGIAVDGNGNVFVADTANRRIQKFSDSGAFQFAWGGSGGGDGQFRSPFGLATDAQGNVYVADTDNNRIQKFSGSGAYITKWGSFGSGDGQFSYPRAVTVDKAGNVYVADSNNRRIQKLDSAGSFLLKWGSYGSADGQFITPQGITLDAAGHVFVVDTGNNRVQKFGSSGQFLGKWGASGSGNGQFTTPTGIAVYRSGAVYVGDTDNDRVQKFVDAAFDLDDDEPTSFTLDPATYTVSEWMPEGWNLADVACSGGTPQVDINKVALTLLPGDDITCTFTNAQESSITIIKEVVGQVPTADWQFSGDLGDFSFPPEGFQTDFYPLTPGSYTVTEAAVPGYSQSVSCDTGEAGAGSVTIDLQAGEDVTCTFTNTFINQPPVAGEDTYVTDEDLALVVNAPGVLGNDSDPNTDPLTAALVDNVTHGTLAFNADGSFTYTPAADYHGPDSFTYKANDGAEDSNVVTVSITINPVNDPPVAADLSVATDEDTPVALSLSASDIEGDNLTYTVVSGPAHGELSGTPPEVTYTPAADYHGPDSFTYQADDAAEDSNIATVSITVNPVNDPPVVAWSPAPASPATLGVTTTAAVTFSDVDSGDSHSCVWNWGDGTSDGPAPCAPGTVAGSHLYAAIGSYSVSMTVTDNAEEGSVTANVAVTWPFAGFFPPVNNPPVVNTVKAGSGVPVKFSLGGDYGLGIIAEGYPKSVRVMCDTGDPTDEIEETVTAGSSSLQYNALTGQYTYVWKTVKLWTGTCRQFRLMLTDGTTHVADFKFK